MIKPKFEYEVLPTIEQVESGYELQISLRITENCNISCDYCLWHNGTVYKTEDIITSIDKLFELFIEIKKNKVLFYFHGGEPTTHPAILSIIDYISCLLYTSDAADE